MMFDGRDIFWLMLVSMLVAILFIQAKPFGLFEQEEPFVDVADFDVLQKAVDDYHKLQDFKDNLVEQLADANARIKVLEDTDWYIKYELTKGELEKERDNQPNLIAITFFSGVLAFFIVFIFTWLYYFKEYKDLKNKNEEYRKKAEQLEVALLAERNKGGKKK
jgi:hypothetical protein